MLGNCPINDKEFLYFSQFINFEIDNKVRQTKIINVVKGKRG